LGYSISSKLGNEALCLQTRDLSKLSHVSEYVPSRLSLVDTKLSFQEAHPGLPAIAQAGPIFILYIHGTALCC
jgi:hypothetical protein